MLVFCAGFIFAQVLEKTINPDLNCDGAVCLTVANGDSSFCYEIIPSLGKTVNSTYTNYRRPFYVFDLSSIPDSASVTAVELTYSTDGGSGTFNVTHVQELLFFEAEQDPETDWHLIGDGTLLESGLSFGDDNFYSNNIKALISNALTNDETEIILGAYSVGTVATLEISLKIEYTIPAPKIDLTIRNDLNSSEGGSIGVGIYPANPISKSSPHNFKVRTTNKLNLEAYDKQSVNNYTWYFDDGEIQGTDSYWEKRQGVNFSNLGNNQSIITQLLTVNDDNAIYSSYLKVGYTMSGTMLSNETWTSIQDVSLDNDLTIPSGVTLTIDSSANIDMNGYKITSTGGTISVDNSADIDPFIVHKNTNGSIAGLYPNLSSAISAVTPFNEETVEINSQYDVSSNVTVPIESTFKLKSNARLDISSSNKITKPFLATMVIESGAEINPDFRLKSGSTVTGLYGSISGAFSDGSYVEARDTVSMTADLSVPSGKTLKLISGAKVLSAAGKYLNVSGTLNATSVTFTKTSTNWGGIKYLSESSGSLNSCTISNSTYGVYFNSSNPSIDDCTISNTSYGVYCTGASPDIENCTISNCSSYGLYAYNSSPNIKSNDISNSDVYMNNCSSELYDNLIEGGGGSYFFYMYSSDPVLDNNTITAEAMVVVEADNGSEPEFGGGAHGTYGLNILTGENADFVVLAEDGSYMLLGQGSAGPYIPSKNSIIEDGCLYPAGAIDAYIEADWCWWGENDEPEVLGDVTCENYLSSQPSGSGSSLSKVVYLPQPTFSTEGESSPEKVLMDEAKQKEKDGSYAEALSLYKNIILQYEDSKYAIKALSKSLELCRKFEIDNALDYLDDLIEDVSNKTLLGFIKARKVTQYRRDNDLTKAIALSEAIIEDNPQSIRENTSLFDLFNFYHKELNDLKKAEVYLEELKTKYPESKLTIIARSDWGEDVSEIRLSKITYNEIEENEHIVLPELYDLQAAYPNPFNPSTTLEYALPVQSDVNCTIFDLSGNIVKEFTFDQNAGTHSITWDASNVSSGIYLIRFVAEASDGSESFVDYQKVTLLK